MSEPSPQRVATTSIPIPNLGEALTAKRSSVRSTISIPTSPGQVKKNIETKAEPPQPSKESQPKPLAPVEMNAVSSLELTQELLSSCLEEIKTHYREAGKNFELAILDQPMEVRSRGVVSVKVTGSVQEEIAEKMRPELLGLIRKLTGAGQLSILVEQAAEEERDRPKLYTNSDKLRYLRDKYPALAELQRKLVLDVDF